MIDYRIFTLFVILFSFAYSSDSYYSGYIYNRSGEVLEGANIVAIDSKGNEFGASSDSGGYFQVFLMPDSDYEIIITFIGYNDYYKNISLNDIEKKITNQIITLDIKSIPLNQLEIVEIINTK